MEQAAPVSFKRPRNDAHERRLIALSGDYGVPALIDYRLSKIEALFSDCAKHYMKLISDLERRDEGRVTAALDAITHAREIALSAVLLANLEQLDSVAAPIDLTKEVEVKKE